MTVRRIKKPRVNGQFVYRWVADVDYCHPDGRRERIRKMPRVQSRVSAERLEREILLRLEQRSQPEAEAKKPVPTLAEFWVEYWLNHVTVNNRPSERQAKKGIMTHHLLPAFGHMQLDAIPLKAIEVYKATKIGSAHGYTAKTINNHLAVLRGLLHMAEAWGEIAKAVKFRDLKVASRAALFLSPDESNRLAAAVEPKWKALVVVALNTGLRIGELLALRWEDVSWSLERLAVRRSDWKGILGPPKGGKPREVPLNAAALDALRSHQHERGALIFCSNDGQRISQAMCRRPLHRACVKAGLPKFQWHTLRHTFASQLVAHSVPLRAVQKLLGHANYSTTERYAHLAPDVTKLAVSYLCRPASEQAKPLI